MVDISNPQKRERLLIVIAALALGFVVINTLPAQFRTLANLRQAGNELRQNIENREQLARDRVAIQSRLAAMEQRALAAAGTPVGDEAEYNYRIWLENLALSAGLNVASSTQLGTTGGVRGAHGYARHRFTLAADGNLNQIAEFLRRFYRAEFLHTIQTVTFRPPNPAGITSASFRVEVLSLPQIRYVHIPNTEGILATDAEILAEMRMLEAIRDRAIIFEYRPPAPPPPVLPPAPPVDPFPEAQFCYFEAIVLGVDGIPQVWINRRMTGRTYRLTEGGSFVLEDARCVIYRIDNDNQKIVLDINGAFYSLRAGQHFDMLEEYVGEL